MLSGESLYCRQDELIERSHHRNRIPGQSEEGGVTESAKCNWASGLHRDFPEADLAEALDQGVVLRIRAVPSSPIIGE